MIYSLKSGLSLASTSRSNRLGDESFPEIKAEASLRMRPISRQALLELWFIQLETPL
jgi:hypothetical protein